MGFTSKIDTSLSEIAGSHFAEFAALADRHKDGWGIATDATLVKEISPASQSSTFSEAVIAEEKAALLHFRLATNGFPVDQNNSHPFTQNGISFIHNGAINPSDFLSELIAPELFSQLTGVTDSEKYFFSILTLLKSQGLVDSLMQIIRKIKESKNYSSLNCMLLSPDQYIIACEFQQERVPSDQPSDYYRIFYKVESDGVVVASSGWDQVGWTELPNHTVMVVDRRTLALDFISL
jgi:predicted glutamine amidotransferase